MELTSKAESRNKLCVFGMSDNLGGTEVYLITLYRAIQKYSKRDLQFDFLLNHNAGVIPYEAEILKRGGRIFREYYTRSEKRCAGYIDIHTLFDMHPEWCGVYLNVQNIHTAYRLIIEAARRGISYRILHAHNSGYETAPHVKDKLYEMYFHKTSHRYVTNFLACSEDAGNWMFPDEKFEVVPDAVEFEAFRINEALRQETRKRLDISGHEIVMGFCGRLEEQKDPLFLVDVFNAFHALVTESRLLVVGDGSLREAVQQRIYSYGLEDSVILTGGVQDVNPYLQAMDCFVLPSRYEGFGIALLEAEAAGLWCYTTVDVVPTEVNQTGRVSFLSKKAGAERWAAIIKEQGFDKKDCQKLLRRCPYSTEQLYKKFYEIFNLTVSK